MIPITWTSQGDVKRTPLAGALVAGGLAILASHAAAVTLRSPQVAFDSGPLQAYVNEVEPGHDVRTEQLDAPMRLPGGSRTCTSTPRA